MTTKTKEVDEFEELFELMKTRTLPDEAFEKGEVAAVKEEPEKVVET